MKTILDRIARRFGYIPADHAAEALTAAVADATNDMAVANARALTAETERDRLKRANTGQTRVIEKMLTDMVKTRVLDVTDAAR